MWDVTSVLIVILICLWLRWRRNQFRILKDLGIPGPEPNIFFGNYLQITKKNPLTCRNEWCEKYGKIYGYYFGAVPIVVINDVNLIKKVQIGDFHKFLNRPSTFDIFKNIGKPGEGLRSQLVLLRDRRWKDIRSILSPSFTTSKLKSTIPIINSTIDSLFEIIDSKIELDEPFDIYLLFQAFTMDIIGRTAFGIQTDCQKNPDDPFLRSTKVLLAVDMSAKFILLFFCFPEFVFILEFYLRILMKLSSLFGNPVKELTDAAKLVIKARKENPSNRRQDILQLMIDAKMSDLNESNVENFTADHENMREPQNVDDSIPKTKIQKNSRGMTEAEITDNAVLFLFVGLETTSTAMAYTTHFLVHLSEIQDRVRDEVEALVNREGNLDYETVQQLQYLDQVMSETLRIYPPIYFFVNREVGEDTNLDGVSIRKGMNVEIPVYSLQHDKRFWPDPEKFDPERFSPSNKQLNEPMAFQAFGAGPRNCMGIRFAQIQYKLALARLIYKYRLVKCEKTDPDPLPLKVKFASTAPLNGIYIKAVPISR